MNSLPVNGGIRLACSTAWTRFLVRVMPCTIVDRLDQIRRQHRGFRCTGPWAIGARPPSLSIEPAGPEF
jgi:hypothetical protein